MNNRIYQSPDLYTVLSNRLLTSLYSIQSTLDSLRAHRPDYAPRTGFVWPIVDPSLTEDSGKKQEDIVPHGVDGIPEASTKRNDTLSSVPKRRQNNSLLMNAMQATAMHATATASLSSITLASGAESIPPEPITMSSVNRKSATPAPVISRVPTPKPVNQEPPPKSAPGGGKKKRKRTMAMAPENP